MKVFNYFMSVELSFECHQSKSEEKKCMDDFMERREERHGKEIHRTRGQTPTDR